MVGVVSSTLLKNKLWGWGCHALQMEHCGHFVQELGRIDHYQEILKSLFWES